MNKIYRTLIIVAIIAFSATSFAGNRDRSGQAGASHLLIDPWAKSNGWSTAGVAEIRGLESVYSNIAGMAFTDRTEFAFSRTQYLEGSGAGIGINSFGVVQALARRENGRKVKDFGVLGVSVFTMNFGSIEITRTDQPEGNMGTFSPTLSIIGIHYAKSFNQYIHGGISFKIVNESISDLRANGFAIDAGVQYLAGPYENFKIGVTLKNIGLPMSYKGDGMTVRGVANNSDHEMTLAVRSAESEMPSLLTLGLSYDFLFFGKDYAGMSKQDKIDDGLTRNDAIHRITLAGSFTANSYSRDVFAVGIEYGFMQFFQVRAGYNIEAGMFNKDEISTWYTGPSAGLTVGIPLAKKNKGNQKLFLDYAYRFTTHWRGNHYIGIKVAL